MRHRDGRGGRATRRRGTRALTLVTAASLLLAPGAASAVGGAQHSTGEGSAAADSDPHHRALVDSAAASERSAPSGRSGTREALPLDVDTTAGYDGMCTDDLGVTVVIDFQDLGAVEGQDGETIVRCAPPQEAGEPFDGTGRDALLAAGIDVEGTSRYPTAFVCRLEGRPTSTETIEVPGNPDYRELCRETPPAGGFWSYWHSDGVSGAWTSSNLGLENRKAVPGGFEGWSFFNPEPGDPFAPIKPEVQPLRGDVVRLTGGNRYETAANVAAQYQPGMDRLFVATGADYPDALAASAIAGMQGSPILLTRAGAGDDPDSVPGATRRMLENLYAREIVVLGGTSSVDADAVAQIEEIVGHERIVRVAGDGRYDTALQLLERYGDDGTAVSVANGLGFADALTASAVGARDGAPMLLVQPDNVPSVLDAALRDGTVTGARVYGGPGAVTETVRGDLATRLGVGVARSGGANRWETSAAVAARYGAGVDVVYVATGQDFPDALAGGALAGRDGAPVVLTDTGRIPNASRAALARLAPAKIVVLGGPGVVSADVLTELEGFVTP